MAQKDLVKISVERADRRVLREYAAKQDVSMMAAFSYWAHLMELSMKENEKPDAAISAEEDAGHE